MRKLMLAALAAVLSVATFATGYHAGLAASTALTEGGHSAAPGWMPDWLRELLGFPIELKRRCPGGAEGCQAPTCPTCQPITHCQGGAEG